MLQAKSEINTLLASRIKEKYEPFGLRLSAQAIIVGQDEDHIESCHVRMNGVTYDVENPLKALDVAFKTFHSLDSHYPKESEREWLFLERAVFGLNQGKRADAMAGKLVKEYSAFKKA